MKKTIKELYEMQNRSEIKDTMQIFYEDGGGKIGHISKSMYEGRYDVRNETYSGWDYEVKADSVCDVYVLVDPSRLNDIISVLQKEANLKFTQDVVMRQMIMPALILESTIEVLTKMMNGDSNA